MASSIRGIKQMVRTQLWRGVKKRVAVEKPLIIAVGGSVGKTSTKEALGNTLHNTGSSVQFSYGNMATDIGLALTLLGVNEPPRGAWGWLHALWRSVWVQMPFKRQTNQPVIYCLEYSVDAVGDTQFLTDQLRPQVAVMAGVFPVHMESFKTVEAMLTETFELFQAVPEDGTLIMSADDPLTVQAYQRFNQDWVAKDRYWYGTALPTDLNQFGAYAHDVQYALSGASGSIRVILPGGVTEIPFKTEVFAHYQLAPLVAATLVACLHGADVEQLTASLATHRLAQGRGRVLEGKRQTTLIDDTANASPEAVEAGLRMIKAVFSHQRRVAVLGSMNELGELEAASHQQVATVAASCVDALVVVGKNARAMKKAAEKAGMLPGSILTFATPEQLLSQINQIYRPRDLIYVKASQNGMFLERVIKALLANPEDAAQLVRQGKFWHNKQ